MIVYPAIDLRGGRCVRLQQGDFAAETVFADDPAEAAHRWAAQGAEWLHVVNLDGALGRSAEENLAALGRILQAISLPVQFGGGVRSADDVGRLLDLGVARVVLGTVAVRDPHVVAESLMRYGVERVCVGIDAREGRAAIQGWAEVPGIGMNALAEQMRALGVARLVYTDVGRDGMLSGVNVEATARLARETRLRVIASGGVASLDDIRALLAYQAEGIEGVIIGMALYRGVFSLAEAIKVAQGG